MRIEYVLIEKQGKQKLKPSKSRITQLLKKCFPSITSGIISIKGKRKTFDLTYQITCCPATDNDSTDNIYNIAIECTHSNKQKCVELIEKAHNELSQLITLEQDCHLIIADDELSEYFCNRAYPKYQHFERQLRHLIFKVVTKAYGNLWTKLTLPSELKKRLKDDITSRRGTTKEDILIEEALHEMTMGQLIDYLFYGPSEIMLPEYIDEHYPVNKLKQLSKEELITIIEKTRKKSVWNLFIAKDIDINEPQRKLSFLRENRNKVAHCKQFYSDDYNKSIEYIDLFIPKIESAIENASIADSLSIRSVLLGFGDFTIGLANMAAKIGQMLSPALLKIAEINASITAALRSETIDNLTAITESFSKIALQSIQFDIPKIDIPTIDTSTLDLFDRAQNQFNNIKIPLLPSDSAETRNYDEKKSESELDSEDDESSQN